MRRLMKLREDAQGAPEPRYQLLPELGYSYRQVVYYFYYAAAITQGISTLVVADLSPARKPSAFLPSFSVNVGYGRWLIAREKRLQLA